MTDESVADDTAADDIDVAWAFREGVRVGGLLLVWFVLAALADALFHSFGSTLDSFAETAVLTLRGAGLGSAAAYVLARGIRVGTY